MSIKEDKANKRIYVEGYKFKLPGDCKEPIVVKPSLSDGIYIGSCKNAVIKIEGKFKNLTINNAEKTGVVFETAVVHTEIVRCKQCQIQVTQKCPLFQIDKSERCQLYLTKDCLESKLVCASSTSTNVYFPGKTEDDDMVEIALPEQLEISFDKDATLSAKAVIPGQE